jgi:hypothetical protein
MDKGKYLIDVNVYMGKGKQKRRKLEEKEGYIDTENNIAYSINEYGDCRITDINTGLSIYSCYAKTIDDCIKDYKNVVTEIIRQARSKYYYDNCVKVFEFLKTCSEPVTVRTIEKAITQ